MQTVKCKFANCSYEKRFKEPPPPPPEVKKEEVEPKTEGGEEIKTEENKEQSSESEVTKPEEVKSEVKVEESNSPKQPQAVQREEKELLELFSGLFLNLSSQNFQVRFFYNFTKLFL